LGEMAIRCPRCGREVPDSVSYCAVCGSPVGEAYARAQYAMQKPLREKKGTCTALVVVIVVVILAIVGGVVLFMFQASSSPFTADLRWQVLTYGVEVYGRIYNHGSSDAVAILHLRIFDGTDWHKYDVSVGLVPANGFKFIRYTATGLDTSDYDSVNVQYSVSRG